MSIRLSEAVKAFDADRYLSTASQDITEYFVGQFSLDLPIIAVDQITVGQREVSIEAGSDRWGYHYSSGQNVRLGVEYECHLPFSGTADLFSVQPTTYSMGGVRASVHGNIVIIRVSGVDLGATQVKSSFDEIIKTIQQHLGWLAPSVVAWNATLGNSIPTMVEARRQKLMSDRNVVANLGFKLRERPGEARTFVAPEVRRKISPSLPPVGSVSWKPEPILSDAIYEHILQVVGSGAVLMERSPSTFHGLGEEALRDHFLFLLNGHFEGQATGETFNKLGKTDILIRSQNRNIFIGECKFWGGPKILTETLTQLLGYTSWRDTKVAIIIFNRNKDFTRVLEQVRPATEAHPNFKRFVSQTSETRFNFVFGQPDDDQRELLLSILIFDIP